jgi:hypothetical protein
MNHIIYVQCIDVYNQITETWTKKTNQIYINLP